MIGIPTGSNISIAVGKMHQHEAASADVAGRRMGNGQRQSHGHRGVNRIAAGFQHSFADIGRVFFPRADHAAACAHRLPRIEAGGKGEKDK